MEKIKSLWFNLSDKLRFLVIGCFNAGVSYLIFSIICFFVGEEYYQISLASAWLVSSIISFTTQKFFVFNANGNPINQYFKCCITWFFSYLINAALLEAFVKYVELNVYISQILATGCCAIFNYVLFKKFAFKSLK